MLDKIIIEFDKALKNITIPANCSRKYPYEDIEEQPKLSQKERNLSISLMRVNHSGEICAQALYQGQALATTNQYLKNTFAAAAIEEVDHLAWTYKRISKLNGKTSVLNPILYFNSLTIGVMSGLLGDRWSLGFLHETELQVEKHLTNHQNKISPNDKESICILQQMKIDEQSHAQMAKDNGAIELPQYIKHLMTFMSKLMIKATYYI